MKSFKCKEVLTDVIGSSWVPILKKSALYFIHMTFFFFLALHDMIEVMLLIAEITI